MGSTIENEDSPPWLDCFLKSFSIENTLLETNVDSSVCANNTFQQDSTLTPLPSIDGLYHQIDGNYEGQFNTIQDCTEKWPNIIETCSPPHLENNYFMDSTPIPEIIPPPESQTIYPSPAPSYSQQIPETSFPSTPTSSTEAVTKVQNSSSVKKSRKSLPKKSPSCRKKLSPQSLKEKRDEQACKKIAQCRVGFSLEKKVIIPIFLALILKERKYNPSTLRWIDKSSGIFKVEDQDKIAELWATMKKKSKSCYGNFSRSIRHHHHTGYLEHDRRKLIFKFSSDFTFWK